MYGDGLEAIAAIRRGDIKPGHVLVVHGMGPKGGPAMAGPASAVVFALFAAELQHKVAFICDGQLSGLCNKGMTIAEVSPEGAVGGPIALVQNGDRITIDVDRLAVDIEVDAAVLAERRAAMGEIKPREVKGYLAMYREAVQGMETGVILLPC